MEMAVPPAHRQTPQPTPFASPPRCSTTSLCHPGASAVPAAGGQSAAADGKEGAGSSAVPRLVPPAHGGGSSPLAWPMEPVLHPGFQRGQEGAPHVTAPTCPRAVPGPQADATRPSQHRSPTPGARPWLSAGAGLLAFPGEEKGAGREGGTDPGSSRYCRTWPAARGPRRLSLRAAGPRTAASWSWTLARRSPSTGSTGTTPPTRRELQHSTAPSSHAPGPPWGSSLLLLLLAPRGPGHYRPLVPRGTVAEPGTVPGSPPCPAGTTCPIVAPKPKPQGPRAGSAATTTTTPCPAPASLLGSRHRRHMSPRTHAQPGSPPPVSTHRARSPLARVAPTGAQLTREGSGDPHGARAS